MNHYAPLSLFPTVSVEHCGDCQCDNCLDVTTVAEPELPDSDEPLTVLAMDVSTAETEYVTSNATVQSLVTAATALEALYSDLGDIPYTATATDGVILHSTVNSVLPLVSTGNTTERPIPALECFTSDPSTAWTVSIESIGEWLKRVWEAIKRALRSLYDSILALLRKLVNYNSSVRRKAQRNSQEVAALVSKPLHPPIVNAHGYAYKSRLDPATEIELSEGAIKALWDPRNNAVTTTLVASVERYRHMFVNGFVKWADHQLRSNEANANLIDKVITRAHFELERDRKPDVKLAKDVATYAAKKLYESSGGLEEQKVKMLTPFVGLYLGGIQISVSKTETDFFSKVDFVPVTTAVLPLLTLPELTHLTNTSVALAIAYEQYTLESYNGLGEALNRTTAKLENAVEDLTANYSEYPTLLKNFQIALDDNHKRYTSFINTVYRVISTTSKLCAVLHGEVIPAYIDTFQP